MTSISTSAKDFSGSDYYNVAKETMEQVDSLHGNGDGLYSVEEFKNCFARRNEVLFANNDAMKEQAYQIIDSCDGLYTEYAGDDGLIDADEYCSMLDTDEYDRMITSWRALAEDMEKSDAELRQLFMYIDSSGNSDGITTVDEFYKYKTVLYNDIFNGHDDLAQKAQELAKAEYENMKKYADEDGVLTLKNYYDEFASKESKELSAKFQELKQELSQREDKNKGVLQKGIDKIVNFFKGLFGVGN